MNGFARVLRARREAAGYPSARAFYRALGGRAFFGCTYKAYVNVETGVSRPTPRLLERLVAGLRLAIGRKGVAEFAGEALRELLGSGEFHAFATRALARAAVAKPKASALEPAPSSVFAEPGETLLEHPLFLRASRAELLGYAPHLDAAARAAAEGAAARTGERFSVELTLDELFPF